MLNACRHIWLSVRVSVSMSMSGECECEYIFLVCNVSM